MRNNILRKGLVIGIIILFVGASVVPSTGMEEKSIIGRAILYVGGIGPGNYSYIQDAVDNASDGDTIYVYNGTYCENIILDNPIELLGENQETTFIDGNNNGDDVVRIYYTNNVTVNGFTIQNSGTVNNFDSGIEVYHSHYNIITNNKIVSNFRGVWFYNCDFNIFSDNIVESNNITGVFLRVNSEYNSISNNTIISNHIGLYLSESSNNVIVGNNINGNDEDGIYLVSSNNNTILENYIEENWYGLRLWDSNNNAAERNTIYQIEYYGISLSQSSNNNKIVHNNLSDNNHQSWDECNNFWNNTYPSGGNYWSDFDEPGEGAYDNDNDWIIDSPYNITGDSNQDFYPLKYPWGENPPVANFTYYANNRTFDASSSYDRDGYIVSYEWDFDDGTTGQGKNYTHAYDESAIYNVTLTIEDNDGYQNSISKNVEVEANYPPEAPLINGQLNGKIGNQYIYTFISEDPNGDDVYYEINWGDGNITKWDGPHESNIIMEKEHTWYEQGSYIIMARAKDVYDASGEWGTLEVTMPKNKPFIHNFPLLSWLFERFPNIFSILGYVLGL